MGFQFDAEDFADSGKIIVGTIPPFIIEVAFAIPFAGTFLRGFSELIEGEDGGFNDGRHMSLHK